MALSQKAKDILVIAMANRTYAAEVAAAIDAGGNAQAANIAAIVASNIAAIAAPAAAVLNAVFDDLEVEAALLAKADQSAVATLQANIETRFDALDSKINAILTSLKNASLMASS